MSTPFNPTISTFKSDEDLSASAWFLVRPVGGVDNDIEVAGAGELAMGALTNDVPTATSGTVYVPVQIGGIIKVSCGAACVAGSLAMSDASGEALTATDGNYAFGIALGEYVDGEIGSFLWAPSYLETT
jgi:hypothetical protein